jgi:hypothetical protein
MKIAAAEISCVAAGSWCSLALSKRPAWHHATVLPDGSNDIRKIRNGVGLDRNPRAARLVTKANPLCRCGGPRRLAGDLPDAAMI